MAIIFKSKYDKLGFWGWFLYIPFLMIAFWCIDNQHNRMIPLLFLFIPLIKGIIYFVKEIYNHHKRKKYFLNKTEPLTYDEKIELKNLNGIVIYYIFLIILLSILGLLIYNATLDFK